MSEVIKDCFNCEYYGTRSCPCVDNTSRTSCECYEPAKEVREKKTCKDCRFAKDWHVTGPSPWGGKCYERDHISWMETIFYDSRVCRDFFERDEEFECEEARKKAIRSMYYAHPGMSNWYPTNRGDGVWFDGFTHIWD